MKIPAVIHERLRKIKLQGQRGTDGGFCCIYIRQQPGGFSAPTRSNPNHIVSTRLGLPVDDALSLASGGLRNTWGTGLSSIPGSHSGEQIFILLSSASSPRLKGIKSKRMHVVESAEVEGVGGKQRLDYYHCGELENLKCDKCVYGSQQKRGKSESRRQKSFTRKEG